MANDPLGLGQMGEYRPTATNYEQVGGWGSLPNAVMPSYPTNSFSYGHPASRRSPSLSKKTIRHLILGGVIGTITLVLVVVGIVAVPRVIAFAKRVKLNTQTAVAPTQLANWETHATRLGPKVEYKLPAPVSVRINDTKQTLRGPVPREFVASDSKSHGAYFVGVSSLNLPSGLNVEPVRLLDENMDEIQRSIRGTLISRKEIQFENVPGFEYVFTGREKGVLVECHSRMFVVNDYLYTIGWVGQQGNIPTGSIQYFFESLRFKK